MCPFVMNVWLYAINICKSRHIFHVKLRSTSRCKGKMYRIYASIVSSQPIRMLLHQGFFIYDQLVGDLSTSSTLRTPRWVRNGGYQLSHPRWVIQKWLFDWELKSASPLTWDFIYIKDLGSVTWKSLARTRVQSVARGGPLCTMVIENKDSQNLMLLK